MTRNFRASHSRENGQAAVFLLLALGLFLLGGIGLAVDMSNLWMHRQSAQSAADSACTAAAMGMVNNASGAAGNTWIGSPFKCSGNSSAPPCFYAAKNDGSGRALHQEVVTSYRRLR